jgi:hypothetical protein
LKVSPQFGDSAKQLRAANAVTVGKLHHVAMGCFDENQLLKNQLHEKDELIKKLQGNISEIRSTMDQLDQVRKFSKLFV